MKKLIMLKGLPASGKSTWAKEYIDKHQNQAKRVNKDDLRAMLDNSVFSKKNESFVINMRNHIVESSLQDGLTIIVDDTNFNPVHEKELKEIAAKHSAAFEILEFKATLKDCLDRDSRRANPVGKKVIMDMWRKYTPDIYTPPTWDAGKEPAIIVDLDGTLAHSNGKRGPYDWGKVGVDMLDRQVYNIILKFSPEYKILIVSGRDGVCEPETRLWLEQNEVPYDSLLMRPEGNTEKDSIIKSNIYENQIRPYYDVLFVLDDRDQVVDMWRNKGLKCLQANYGNF